jgi:hypothetical protein
MLVSIGLCLCVCHFVMVLLSFVLYWCLYTFVFESLYRL